MSKKITGKVLSIQLGREETQLVLLEGMNEILHTVAVPTPAGAVDDGMIRDQDAIREMLKEAKKDPAFKKVRNVVFTLCTSQVISEVATVPELPAAKLEKLLRANADMYFPVDTQDYRIVWQVIGPKETEEGEKMVAVQLWAVPSLMVRPYYKVANSCGFSVMAIDYCGHSMATAVGASFAKPQKTAKQRKKLNLNQELSFGGKKKEAPVDEPELFNTEVPATDMHLYLDRDVLGMTFVQNGQVVMQRIIHCGNNPEYQFSELAMMLEYFRSTENGRGSAVRGIASGYYAEDRSMLEELADMLGISVTYLNAPYNLRWCLCVGAAGTDLDFGNPALDIPVKTRRRMKSQLWQYALVLVGALVLMGMFMFLLFARLDWQNKIDRMNSVQQALTIQVQKTAGFADNYYEYKNMYDAYSSDWDTVFANLQTYNDNLVLVLDELETILPENVSVAGMQIGANGLNVTFACETKEEAAYLIMALRDMQYADLMLVSDIEGGGNGPATSYGPEDAEEAPDEGSFQLSEEDRLLLETAINTDLNPYAVGYDLGMGYRVKQNFLGELKEEYGFEHKNKYASLAQLKEEMGDKLTYEQRAYAFYQLCTANPFAMGIAETMIVTDAQNDGDLYIYILDRVREAGSSPIEVSRHTSVEDLQRDVELLVDTIIVRNESYPALDKAEALIATDPEAQKWYLYYLEAILFKEDEVENPLIMPEEEQWFAYYMQLRENKQNGIVDETLVPPELTKLPYLNMEKVITDLEDGTFDSPYIGINRPLNDLLSKGTKELLKELSAAQPSIPTIPVVPTDPTQPQDPTEPEGTEPTTPSTEPEDVPDAPSITPEQEAMIRLYLPVYLRTGKIDFPGASAYVSVIDKYFAEGKTGTKYDKFMDDYISAGNVDEVLQELIAQYHEDPEKLENKAIRTMLDNYYKNCTTNNAALDAQIKKLDTKQEEDANEQVTGWLKTYLNKGKTGNDDADALIRGYLTTGATPNADTTKSLNEYVAAGNLDKELKILLYYYHYQKTAIKDASVVAMFDNYYGDGTGSSVLDSRIKKIGKELASETVKNPTGESGGSGSSGGSGGSGGGSGPKDTRIYFAVVLNYTVELRDAELNRKGLDYAAKVKELEVGE